MQGKLQADAELADGDVRREFQRLIGNPAEGLRTDSNIQSEIESSLSLLGKGQGRTTENEDCNCKDFDTLKHNCLLTPQY